MRFWITFAAYEAVWFSAVVGAGRDHEWPGVLAALLFLAWRLSVSRNDFGAEWRLLCVSLTLGAVLECLCTGAGWVRYAATDTVSPVPAWLLGLWASFGLTVLPLFGYLRERLWLAVPIGAIGGPASYIAAARGWHAVTWLPPAWRGVAALGIGWGIALPLLVALARRWTGTSSPTDVTRRDMP